MRIGFILNKYSIGWKHIGVVFLAGMGQGAFSAESRDCYNTANSKPLKQAASLLFLKLKPPICFFFFLDN